ncbi:MAG: PIG-L family deacetylase, partial [Lentisphaerae bacterium]|nr:PIG-L family deacetylase [Lentisphaerota bacterium]
MKFTQQDADLYVPDGTPLPRALERTTHLAVGAHPDDQELMAYHGIAACFGAPDRWFTGVCLTDGRGSSRAGPYARYTDAEMAAVRRLEQRKAAGIGDYACEIQLAYRSAHVHDPSNTGVLEDLVRILETAQPQVVYLHNPADKHDSHV